MKKWFNRQLAKLEDKIFKYLYDELTYQQMEDELWQTKFEKDELKDEIQYLQDVLSIYED